MTKGTFFASPVFCTVYSEIDIEMSAIAPQCIYIIMIVAVIKQKSGTFASHFTGLRYIIFSIITLDTACNTRIRTL